MKKFTFFLVILLIIIGVLLFGLFKNRLTGDSGSDVIGDEYVISASKNQSISLVQTEDNAFQLKGQVTDGTHSKIVVRVVEKGYTANVLDEHIIDLTTEPFEEDITMPENETDVHINLYYRDSSEYAIVINAIELINDGGSWSIAESANNEENSKILGQGKTGDFLCSKDELLEIPEPILALSDTITKAHTNDYDKAYAIYLWLCEHIFMTDSAEDKSLEYVFNTRIADTESYANYFAALLRAQDIPCTVVECDGGYYFNEIYVDGKWLNVQMDRDTFNKYSNQQYIYDRRNIYTHFGVPNNIISVNYVVKSHKK